MELYPSCTEQSNCFRKTACLVNADVCIVDNFQCTRGWHWSVFWPQLRSAKTFLSHQMCWILWSPHVAHVPQEKTWHFLSRTWHADFFFFFVVTLFLLKHLLWNLAVYYSVYKSPPLMVIFSHLNPIHNRRHISTRLFQNFPLVLPAKSLSVGYSKISVYRPPYTP